MIEKMIKFGRGVGYYPYALYLRWSLAVTRKLLFGPHAWSALDKLGIPGFGTDLIRVDFPPSANPMPVWGHGKPLHRELAELLAASSGEQGNLLAKCLAHAGACLAWPETEDAGDASLPWRDNCFLTMWDMVAEFGMLAEKRPRRYVEIGSGMSTRVAYQARMQGSFPMEIISIDPCPRVDVERLCDRVFRKRLEEFPAGELADLSGDGSVLFFDGSHRCFPGSDVTVFFLDILPSLKPGTLVHIHDIYLPEDYPARLAKRYWSEQYVLAAYLLGGSRRVRPILPCHYLGATEPTKQKVVEALGRDGTAGSSFWMEVTR
jgi:hypothetical protein